MLHHQNMMYFTLPLLFIMGVTGIISYTTATPTEVKCRLGFTKLGDVCYNIPYGWAPYTQAVAKCRSRGACLAEPRTQVELDLLRDIVAPNVQYWIGGSDVITEGTFVWESTGEEVTIDGWLDYQPNNAWGGENCMCVVNNYGAFGLQDEKCDKWFNYICQADVVRLHTPVLTANPADTTVGSGTSVTLTCTTGSSGVVTYTLMKDSNAIVSSGAVGTYVSTPTLGTFTYTCKVTINTVDSIASNAITITVVETPHTPFLSAAPADTTFGSGTSVTLTCTTESSGVITYTFLKDSNVVDGIDVGTYVVSTPTLGTFTYTCKVTINTVNSMTSNAITITVVETPQTPALSANPSKTTIENGASITLTCSTGSSGMITYTFMKDSNTIASISVGTYVVSTPTLGTFTYTCKVTINTVDSMTSNEITLTVVEVTTTTTQATTSAQTTKVTTTQATTSAQTTTQTAESHICDPDKSKDNCGVSSCQVGWKGKECKQIDCSYKQYCVNHTCNELGHEFNCSCKIGYENDTPKICVDIDECKEKPTRCGIHHCNNTIGSFHCTCINDTYENIGHDLCSKKITADPDTIVSKRQQHFTWPEEIEVKVFVSALSTIFITFVVYNGLMCLKTILWAMGRFILTKPVSSEVIFVWDLSELKEMQDEEDTEGEEDNEDNEDYPEETFVDIELFDSFSAKDDEVDIQNKQSFVVIPKSGIQNKKFSLAMTKSGIQNKKSSLVMTKSRIQNKKSSLAMTKSVIQNKKSSLVMTQSGIQNKKSSLVITQSVMGDSTIT